MARFCRYIEKIFHFSTTLSALDDPRPRPQIPVAAVWMSVYVSFATRRGSLHALESELWVPGRLEKLVGPRKPSADTMGRAFGGLQPYPQNVSLRANSGKQPTGAGSTLLSPLFCTINTQLRNCCHLEQIVALKIKACYNDQKCGSYFVFYNPALLH